MKSEVEEVLKTKGKLTPEQIKRKLSEQDEDSYEPSPKDISIKRTKLGRDREAEKLVKEHSDTNVKVNVEVSTSESDKDVSQDSKQTDQSADTKSSATLEEQEVVEESKTKDKDSKDNKDTVSKPIGFLQSIIVIFLSGTILLTFGVFAWKALDDTFAVDIYDDITGNIGVLNGEVDIEETDNVVWDILQQEDSSIHRVQVPYSYNWFDKIAIFEYKGITFNFYTKHSGLKFSKEGTLVAEIYFDNYGELEQYKVIEVLE